MKLGAFGFRCLKGAHGGDGGAASRKKERPISQVIRSLVFSYAKMRGRSLTEAQVDTLTEYLLPYTHLSPYVPTAADVLCLSSALDHEAKAKIRELVDMNSPCVNKALYFLLKIRNHTRGRGTVLRVVEENRARLGPRAAGGEAAEAEDLEQMQAAEAEIEQNMKNASIGVHLGLFRELASSPERARDRVGSSTLEMCHFIYYAGVTYKAMRETCEYVKVSEESLEMQVFYSVIEEYLDKYKSAIYEQEAADGVMGFYVRNMRRMRKLERTNHLCQELLCYETVQEGRKKLDLFGFIRRNRGNVEVEELVRGVERQYVKPIDAQIEEWVGRGTLRGASRGFFIRERAEGDLWERYAVDYGELPASITRKCSEEILYVGKVLRLMRELRQKLGPALEAEQGGECASTERTSILSDDYERYIRGLYDSAKARMEREFFRQYSIAAHLARCRDIFLLARDDFAQSLIRSLADLGLQAGRSQAAALRAALPAAVDSSLKECFGEEGVALQEIVDVEMRMKPHGFPIDLQLWPSISLVYRPGFPFDLVTSKFREPLARLFQFFWSLKVSIFSARAIHGAHRGADARARAIKVHRVLLFLLDVEFYFLERVVGKLWAFADIIEKNKCYDISKVQGAMEIIVEKILKHCMDQELSSLLAKVALALSSHPPLGPPSGAAGDAEIDSILSGMRALSPRFCSRYSSL